MKVETHNHPTAISPFPGAATGAGGEIRDEGATGRGSRPKAGLTGFAVSNLHLPGAGGALGVLRPTSAPAHLATPLDIMVDGPIGARVVQQRVRPAGAGRLLPGLRAVRRRRPPRLPQADHERRRAGDGLGVPGRTRCAFPPDSLLVQLGGPGMRIGMGGGAASSMASGVNVAELDFDSVQRGNPEIQRRAQEVVNHCWALGADNPILSIHDVGAGGLSNAFPELVDGAGLGGRFDLRRIPVEESGLAPKELWCNESQERYVLAIAPESLSVLAELCDRERCPYAVVGVASADGQLILQDGARRRAVDRHARGGPARQAAQAAARRHPDHRAASPSSTSPASTSTTSRETCCATPRSRASGSSSPSVTARSEGSRIATRWSARGRCRWRTSP